MLAYFDLIAGRRRGLFPSLLRGGLAGLALLYRAGWELNDAAWSVGLRRTRRAPLPVVSVGNLTAGGTGKTPFAAFLADEFHARGLGPVFVSRGYGAAPGQLNDEALVLQRLCPGVPLIQNADRLQACRLAQSRHRAQVAILDDGFQHRRLARDLDLVLVDATNPWGYGRLLPRGLLREPRRALRRASLFVLTRTDLVDRAAVDRLREELAPFGRPILEAIFEPRGLIDAAGIRCDFSSTVGRRLGAFCGLGNPDAFAAALASRGLSLAIPLMRLPDHHRYSSADVSRLACWAAMNGLDDVLTSLKDLVKLPAALPGAPTFFQSGRPNSGVRLWAVETQTRIVAGAAELAKALDRLPIKEFQQTP
jgi:tetraacyldisaccharide 4'-kinase